MAIIEELTRRRLIQTAALYVAIAWGGTEILVFLTESLFTEAAAREVRRYLAILLIAGFPAAMYLAWTRDLRRTARRIVSALAVAVLVAGVIIYLIPPPEPDGALAVTENSIAVLPFEVCEDRASDRTLAAGLAGAVFNRLAQRDRLKVMGRRSVDTVVATAPSVTTIADLLGVEYMLQGVLCRDGLNLSVQAELTDNNGFTVWAQEFTQVVNRFDQVEARLASLVADGVAVRLGDAIAGPQDRAIDGKALEHFLIGQEYLRRRDKDKARTEFEKALAIQPDYAEARFELAWATADIRLFENQADGLKHVRASTEEALVLVRAELQRDAGSFETSRIAGRLLLSLGQLEDALVYREFHEIGADGVAASRARSQAYYTEAEQHFRSALAANPSATEVRVGTAVSMDSQGVARRRESLRLVLDGLDRRDPFNEDLSELAAYRLVEFGRLREAMERLDRFEALPQGKSIGLWWTQLEILQNQGRVDEKFAKLIEILHQRPELYKQLRILYHLWWTVSGIGMLGLVEQAEELYEAVAKIPNPEHQDAEEFRRMFLAGPEDVDADGHGEVNDPGIAEFVGMSNDEILKTWQIEAGGIAGAFWNAGERERAIELLEALQHYPYPPTVWAERRMGYPMLLAGMYMEMGRSDDAAAVLQRVVTELQAEVDAGVRHHSTVSLLAEAYGRQGNLDAALDMLELAVDYGAYDVYDAGEPAEQDPEDSNWRTQVKDDPRFVQLRSRMSAYVEQQRSNIRALLAQNDIEALLAPLMEPEAQPE
ncbi:MAG TPA: tetratricopeptide repeat protein [Woeseiaceae bacterium]